MTGHVSGVPVEELLPALMSSSGAVLILLTSLGTRLRSSRTDRRRTNEMEQGLMDGTRKAEATATPEVVDRARCSQVS